MHFDVIGACRPHVPPPLLTNRFICKTITKVIHNISYFIGDRMPAIKKVSKEDIIDAAVEVLREGGAAAINARSVAKKLGC